MTVRILLVSPRFHGYHASVAASLAARGHDVVTHVYDDHGNAVGRMWHQLRHRLPEKVGAGSLRGLRREETESAVRTVRSVRPEAVVLIKGDTLTESFWEALRGLPRITWLYDEVRRTSYSDDALAAIGPVATYSGLDADHLNRSGVDVRHLPLAYDHRLVPSPTRQRATEISFVGARYPAREAVLAELHRRSIPVRAYGRDWSGHPFDRLRTWRLGAPLLPAERDVSRARAYDVMAASAATLNLHGDQDGFTMRTFEAAGVGAVQLVDRTDIDDLYERGSEVLSWTTEDELVELCRRALADPRHVDQLRVAARRRTLGEHTFDHRVAVLEGAWDTA